MKALTFQCVGTLRHETVPDPRIEDPGDVVARDRVVHFGLIKSRCIMELSGKRRASGKLTVLHPGSQSTRVWVGLGAGKSKTCVSGQITDQDGTVLLRSAARCGRTPR